MAEITTLPTATPTAKITLFMIFTPKLARVHAVVKLAMKSWPGQNDIGTSLTSRRLCDAAITTTTNGNSDTTKPRNSTIWLTRLKSGVRSIIASGSCSFVMHAPLDVAELDEGQRDDDQHQDERLRGGARIVEAFE